MVLQEQFGTMGLEKLMANLLQLVKKAQTKYFKCEKESALEDGCTDLTVKYKQHIKQLK